MAEHKGLAGSVLGALTWKGSRSLGVDAVSGCPGGIGGVAEAGPAGAGRSGRRRRC